MSEIDATELARMKVQTIDAREKCGWHVNVAPDAILALIDALEKARGERDSARALLEYLRKHSFIQQRPGIVKLIAAKLDSKS